MANLKILFRSEAAGRMYNEDNGKIIQLENDRGVLLIVCDGMGGMKAGEVASALAVATIEEWFATERITSEVITNPQDYLKKAIVGADINIKNYSKSHPETDGMGSTVVLAWLIGEKAYVAWCGDSRAYRYNPQLGLERLSHDHSLVQSWVDAGQITEEQAFEHPQSNIITRSLGDPNGVAVPDSAEYSIYNNDVFLLCSDGLCGTLRDNEIEEILSENKDLSQCCEQLWQADKAAGWSDNVTTAMAQVVSGGVALSKVQPEIAESQELEIMEETLSKEKHVQIPVRFIKYIIILLLLLCATIIFYKYFYQGQKSAETPNEEMPIDYSVKAHDNKYINHSKSEQSTNIDSETTSSVNNQIKNSKVVDHKHGNNLDFKQSGNEQKTDEKPQQEDAKVQQSKEKSKSSQSDPERSNPSASEKGEFKTEHDNTQSV